jgi:hypothetical protein
VLAEIILPKVPLDPATGAYTVPTDQLNYLATTLYQKLQSGTIPLTPDLAIGTKRVEVQFPPPPGQTALPAVVPTTNQLSVSFEIVLSARTPAAPVGGVARQARMAAPGAVAARAGQRDPQAVHASTEVAARAGLSQLPPLPQDSPEDPDVVVTQNVAPAPAAPPAATTTVPAAVALPPLTVTAPVPTPAAGINIPIPGGTIQVPGTGGSVQLPGTGGTLHLPGTVRVQLPGSTGSVEVPGTVELPVNGTPAAPPQTHQTLVATPAPSINVNVPVTNIARQPRHSGLFHRNTGPISPQNPTRPPLLERLLNRP